MFTKIASYTSKTWSFVNTNLISILLGGLASHQLTKSYRDQEMKELSADLKILQNDLKSREEDIKKISIANDELRNNYVVLTKELSFTQVKKLECEQNLKEYKWSYDNAPWHCFFLPKPKILSNEYYNNPKLN